MSKNTYDQRLFRSGLRKYIHESRFRWLKTQTKYLKKKNSKNNLSVIEIGCFNCRSLKYLSFVPSKYCGLDAGWEGGIEEASKAYPNYNIKKSTDPSDINGKWDLSLALETLEHLPRPLVLEEYLKRLANHSKTLIATVPMEIGPLFLVKFLYKILIQGDSYPHTFLEVLNQSLGRCHLVTQDEHQGFDYRELVKLIDKYFKIEKIEGINSIFPKFANTQIGIVAHSRLNSQK